MKAARIHIVGMRTWGQLGNILAARTLARAIGSHLPDADVSVLEAEDFIEPLRVAGERIRELTLSSRSPAERHVRYLTVMNHLTKTFSPGLEVESSEAARHAMRPLREHLAATRPHLVIGMKGIISRLSVAAARAAGLEVPVINFVTNHGLLELPIHHAREVSAHIVQFSDARTVLTQHGCGSVPIHVVGPFVAGHNLSDCLAPACASPESRMDDAPTADPTQPTVVVFCNRGGEEYADLLRHQALRHPHIDLTVIAYNDPSLLRVGESLQRDHRPARWRLFAHLDQQQYFREVSRLAECRYPLIVTKSGPNTALEAVFFGVPMLLVESGLPMEHWVIPWVRQNRLGDGVIGSDELRRRLDGLIAEPQQIAEYRRAARAYGAAHFFGSESSVSRILDVVTGILEGSRAGQLRETA